MKKSYCLTALLAILFLNNHSLLLSRQAEDTTNKAFDFLIKEKLRFPSENSTKKGIIKSKTDRTGSKLSDQDDKLLNNDNIGVSVDEAPESEVHAVINPLDSSNIIISPIKTDHGGQPQFYCPIYYTKDFGKSWNQSSFLTLPREKGAEVEGGGDPVLAFDAGGKVYITWIDLYKSTNGLYVDSVFSSTFWAYSNDGGQSWSRETNDFMKSYGCRYDASYSYYNLPFMADKQWLCVDRSNSPYRNNLYATYTKIAPRALTNRSNIVFCKKEASSSSFSKNEVTISQGSYSLTQFSMPEVDNLGNIHVIFYASNGSDNAFYYVRSTDGGTTFSHEKQLTQFVLSGASMLPGSKDEYITGVTQARLYPSPQIAIDKSGAQTSGNIYFVWSGHGISSNLRHGLDVYIIKSSDGGNTWSLPMTVNDDNKSAKSNQFYPSISVNENGVVIVTWYDRRDDFNSDRQTHLYMAYSFDGGNTFGKNIKVTSSPSNFAYIGYQNNEFGIGEYTQVLSTRGYAIPVWSDGRTNNGNLNIYTAFVPIKKDPDGVQAERIETITDKFELFDPAPAVAATETVVRFRLNSSSSVSASLFNESGQAVKTFDQQSYSPGEYSFNLSVGGLPAGAYFFRLETDFGYSVRKIIVAN